MANLHLVTGYAGKDHITAADQGSFNSALFGANDYVLYHGNQLAASVITNNLVRVLDGDIFMQGRHIRLPEDTFVDLAIDNGTQGMHRNDLIVCRYTKDATTGIEETNLVVIKGAAAASNPADPDYTVGDIIGGGVTLYDMPLWRIPLNGLNVQEPERLFTLFDTNIPDLVATKQDKTNLLAAETTIEDGDYFPYFDTSVGGHRKTLWSNIKTTLGKVFAALTHYHAASDITSGTLPVARGGTGLTASPSMLVNLGSTGAANVLTSSPRPGVTGTLPIARGGTGLTASPSMLVNLGSASAANVMAASPRPGVTGTLSIANGGTGSTDAATALAVLGGINQTQLDNATNVLPPMKKYRWRRRSTAEGLNTGDARPVSLCVGTSAISGGGSYNGQTIPPSNPYNSNSLRVYYASGYTVTIDGETATFKLTNPSNTGTLGTEPTALNVVKGKYWAVGKSSGIETLYFTPSDAANATYSSSGTTSGSFFAGSHYLNISAQSLTYWVSIGAWNTITADKSNAYPHKGVSNGFEYEYWGCQIDALSKLGVITTGSYTGTGVYGNNNKSKLTFDCKPDIIIIAGEDNMGYAIIETHTSCFSLLYNTAVYLNYQTWSGATMTWHNTTNAAYQLNSSGVTYNYYALNFTK